MHFVAFFVRILDDARGISWAFQSVQAAQPPLERSESAHGHGRVGLSGSVQRSIATALLHIYASKPTREDPASCADYPLQL